MSLRPVSIALLLALAAAPALAAQQRAETEPNDEFSTANVFHVGDTISAQFPIKADRDFFAFDLAAGARIQFTFIPHQGCRSVGIYSPSRTRLTGKNCYTEDADTLNATASVTGRYYVSITDDDDIGEAFRPYSYQFRVSFYTAPPGGLGNPLTRLAAMGDEITAMTAAPDGDILVMHYPMNSSQNRISRVTPNGEISTFANDVNPTGQIAVDAFGDLLVPSGDAAGNVVWRYNLTTGARTTFTRPPPAQFSYTGVTIGADGDVWLSTPGTRTDGATLVRFDPFGNYKSQVSSVGARTFSLSTAQNGEIFYVAQSTGDVYRLANNTTPVLVISGTSAGEVPVAGEVALDQDGWVYLYNRPQGKLLLYNAQYQLARDPLAQVLELVGFEVKHMMAGPTWLRDRNGKMTSRMLVTRGPGRGSDDPGAREILEVNPRGMGAPGADPGLHIDRAPLRSGAVLAAYADTLRLDGAGSAQWSFVAGQLPTGVTLASNGVLSGTPSTNGTFEFSVKAVNGPRAGLGRFSITIGNAVQVSVSDITNALMGGPSLSAAQVQYLDSIGNRNGQLDVGDLRAYLRAQGQLGEGGGRQP